MNPKLVQIYLPRVFTALIIVVFASFLHFSFNQNTSKKWLAHTESYSTAGELAFSNWIYEKTKDVEGLSEKPELSAFMAAPKKPESENGISVLLKQFSYITGLKNLYTFSNINQENPITSTEEAMPLPKESIETLKKVASQEKEHLFLFSHIGNTPYFFIGRVIATELGSATGYAFFITPAYKQIEPLRSKVFNLAHSKEMFLQVHQNFNGGDVKTLSFEGDEIHNHRFSSKMTSPLQEELMEKAGTMDILAEHGAVLIKTTKSSSLDHISFSAFIAEESLAAFSKTAKTITWSIAAALSLLIILWPGKGPIELIKEKILPQKASDAKTFGSDSRVNTPTTGGTKAPPIVGSMSPPKDIKDKEHVVAYSIRTAMKEERFALLYQPIVDTTTNMPIMYEVFSRIIDEKGTVITPDIFMPVAHKENIVHLIDQGAINTVFNKHLKMSADDLPVPLSVNLSGDTFENISFLETFMGKITGKNAALSQKIVFELNSKEIIEDKNVMKFIRECHSMGVRFAFDYFGGGSDTIKAAKALKLDFVKVNAFQFPITDKEKLKELIILAQAAKKEGIPLIAERAEDPHFIAFCKKIGIQLIQGYGIAKPGPTPTYKPAA